MEKLEKWYQQVSPKEELNFSEAKELYEKAIRTNDDVLKKIYMDKVIIGTLHVIYTYIKRNNINIFKSTSFDLDDIISSFTIIWVKYIYDGILLKKESFFSIFTPKFFSDLYRELCNDRIYTPNQFGINSNDLADLLLFYIKSKNEGKEYGRKDFILEYKKHNKSYMYYEDKIDKIISLFDNIYKKIQTDEFKVLNISATKMHELFYIFLNMGLVDELDNRFVDENCLEDVVIDKINNDTLINEINSYDLNEREKTIIYERFGLDDGKEKSLDEVGKKIGISRERIRQIEAKTLKKLRTNTVIKECK